MADVLQYSIDIVDIGTPFDEKELQRILENAGIIVKGIDWKARWTEGDYDEGKPPYSWV